MNKSQTTALFWPVCRKSVNQTFARMLSSERSVHCTLNNKGSDLFMCFRLISLLSRTLGANDDPKRGNVHIWVGKSFFHPYKTPDIGHKVGKVNIKKQHFQRSTGTKCSVTHIQCKCLTFGLRPSPFGEQILKMCDTSKHKHTSLPLGRWKSCGGGRSDCVWRKIFFFFFFLNRCFFPARHAADFMLPVVRKVL